MDWFNPKHAANPMKQNISCLLTGDLSFFFVMSLLQPFVCFRRKSIPPPPPRPPPPFFFCGVPPTPPPPPPPQWATASSFMRFLDHTQRCATVGRTPLDEWSAQRRDLYLTIHNTHNRPRGHWDRPVATRIYRGADKSLAQPGRKQANVYVRMKWISLGTLFCRGGSWWQLASRCCWSRARPSQASELVSFLVGLRTYLHLGINVLSISVKKEWKSRGQETIQTVQICYNRKTELIPKA